MDAVVDSLLGRFLAVRAYAGPHRRPFRICVPHLRNGSRNGGNEAAYQAQPYSNTMLGASGEDAFFIGDGNI